MLVVRGMSSNEFFRQLAAKVALVTASWSDDEHRLAAAGIDGRSCNPKRADMVIWKFELKITGMQEVYMPEGAELLSVASQNGNLCLWAMVNPSKEHRCRCIEIIGTGNPVQTEVCRKFIGTAVVSPWVWHVFERV